MILFFLLPPTSNTVNKKGHPATISVKTSKKKTFATYQHCFDLHIAQTLTSRLYKLTMTVSNNLPTLSPNLPTLPLYSQRKNPQLLESPNHPNLGTHDHPELLTTLKNHTLYNKLLFFLLFSPPFINQTQC